MPALATKIIETMSLARDKGEQAWLITGAANEADAYAALVTAAGDAWNNLNRSDQKIDDTEADGVYVGRVQFANPDAPGGKGKNTGESSFQFETTGGTTHITHARQHIATWGTGGAVSTAQDGLINVNDGKVDGTDVYTPVYRFSETHYVPAADVDDDYKGTLFALTGRTNDATFKGFAAGEVLFLGARGSKRGRGDWEITFEFAASPNLEDLTIGEITGIDVKGWEYLWCTFVDGTDDDTHTMIKEVKFAHVERVYNEGDMSDLGIGT